MTESNMEKIEDDDSWRPFNEVMFSLNKTLDRYILRPVAIGWHTAVPQKIRVGVSNFFANISLPHTIANQLLQTRFDEAGQNTARLIFNTTVGLGGIIDNSSPLGLPETDTADLGQTLAFWGVPRGPYIVLPLLGPSTLRNAANPVTAGALDPFSYNWVRPAWKITAYAINATNRRSQFLHQDHILYDSLNPYILIRNSYLQQRTLLIQRTFSDGRARNGNLVIDDNDEDFFDSIDEDLYEK